MLDFIKHGMRLLGNSLLVAILLGSGRVALHKRPLPPSFFTASRLFSKPVRGHTYG